ncbi:MAG: 30S ribosomal protein S7 [Parcubacteria group bacterium RIFCSPHIGHO2_01_FULL_47_10b]|nr:MAG: 30S ribosomal protein S7 [Parcubacteria group bacterium RIFCSPHIGHO2_01_FULL_47_10b]
MPRGNHKVRKQVIQPDPRFNSIVLEKFINHAMYCGEKTVARLVVYKALDIAEQKTGKQPMQLFSQALKNVSPAIEVKTKRVGGANYQVPVQVVGERKRFLAMKWMIQAARTKKGKPMADRLAEEIIAASNNEGEAIKIKETTVKQAEANRAFAYLAW